MLDPRYRAHAGVRARAPKQDAELTLHLAAQLACSECSIEPLTTSMLHVQVSKFTALAATALLVAAGACASAAVVYRWRA